MHPHTAGGVGISLLTIFGSVFAIFGALGTIPFPQPTALSATAEVGNTSSASTPTPGTADSQVADGHCKPVTAQCGCGQLMENGKCTQVGQQKNMYQCQCQGPTPVGNVTGKCVAQMKCQETKLPGGQPPSSPTAAQQAQPMGSGVPDVSGDTAVPNAPSPAGQGLPDPGSPSPGVQTASNGDDVFGGNPPTPANANGSIPAGTASQLSGQAPDTGIPIGSVGSGAANPVTTAGSANNPFTSFGSLDQQASFSNPEPVQYLDGSNMFMPAVNPGNQDGPGSASFLTQGNFFDSATMDQNYFSGSAQGGDFPSSDSQSQSNTQQGDLPPSDQPGQPPGSGGTPPPGGRAAPPGGSAGQGGGGQGGGGGGGSPPSMPQIPQPPPQQPQQAQQAQSCSGLSQLLSLCPQPSCTMTASPSTVQLVQNGVQQPVTLSWQSQNAISAYLSALGSVPTSGTYTVYPQSSTGYSLQVTGQYGQASCNANITVSQQCATPPAQPTSGCQGTWQPQTTPLSSGTSCTIGWQCSTSAGGVPAASLSCSPAAAAVGDAVAFSYACGNSTGSSGSGFSTNNQLTGTSSATIQTPPAGANTATYTLTCNNSTLSTSTAAECSVQIVTPQITFLANPPSVPSGETTSIGWVTTGMRSCLVSSPTDINFTAANANDLSPQGVAQTDPITTNTEFDLTCTTAGGSTVSASTVVTVQ